MRVCARLLVLLALGVAGPASAQAQQSDPYEFTVADRQFLAGFSLSVIPSLPPAPSNAMADDQRASRFGQTLFNDTRMSANGRVACASCHQPDRYFTDGLARSRALGTTRRSAPSLLVAAYGPWQFWDGRKDSLWSQALAPIENPDEQGMSRLEVAQAIGSYHRKEYERVFGGKIDWDALALDPAPATPLGSEAAQRNWASLPDTDRKIVDRIFSNVGKAIMAYERRLKLPPSRFDLFVAKLGERGATEDDLRALLSQDEVRGLRLFMGRAGCTTCHNGPLFTNYEFHNVGVPEVDTKAVDLGRYAAIDQLLTDEFSCLSPWSDATPDNCDELRYVKRSGAELVGAYKVPSLRNIAETAPYMQSGQLATLRDVVEHYSDPKPPYYDPAQQPNQPHFDIKPLNLSEDEKRQLIAFLKTLTSPRPQKDPWWPVAPSVAAGPPPTQ